MECFSRTPKAACPLLTSAAELCCCSSPGLGRCERAERQLPSACPKPATLALPFVAGQLWTGMQGFVGLCKRLDPDSQGPKQGARGWLGAD